MSRSRRKTPICGITTAESDKRDKQLGNRRYRRAANVAVGKGEDVPVYDLLVNPYSFSKDGRQYVSKNSQYYEDVMRK